MASSSRAVSSRVPSTRAAAKAAASSEGHTPFYEPPTFETAIGQAPDLPRDYHYQYQPYADITNINRLMKEVYTAITTWARNVNIGYQRNHDNIRDCYQRVCAFYQEVVDIVRMNDTIEPANNTRFLNAMEKVAQLLVFS
ncbi:hypothetical protein E4U47_002766 [Claviceps purpurea]|nr:hypothetical protein E4U47_002766 [Claviceps purpurea]